MAEPHIRTGFGNDPKQAFGLLEEVLAQLASSGFDTATDQVSRLGFVLRFFGQNRIGLHTVRVELKHRPGELHP
ncbi:hypothetical protein D3C71_2037490 [compost metagenome]